MKKGNTLALIFGSAPLGAPSGIAESLARADMVIAADGGANHCAYLDMVPDYLIGDLDSIEPQLLKHYEKNRVEIIRHPREKDATDLELALNLAMQEGATDIWLLGVIGKRWDMSLANIMLAASERFSTMPISLYSVDTIIKILHPGKTHLFRDNQGKTVSFLPLNKDVEGIKLDGFAYALEGEDLEWGSTKGVSNIIKDMHASEIHEKGVLLYFENI